MSEKEFIKTCKDAKNDYLADNPGAAMDDAAFDMADNMLYDPRMKLFVQWKLNTKDKQTVREYVADEIYN